MMLSLVLGILNFVLWIWFIGFLVSIPVILTAILHDEGRLTWGDVILCPISAASWPFFLSEFVEIIEDITGYDIGTEAEKFFEGLFDKEIYRP